MREPTNFARVSARHILPDHRRGVGDLDSRHGRAVAPPADQRGHHDGSRFSQALAIRARYPGQSLVAAIGVICAGILVTIWIVRHIGG